MLMFAMKLPMMLGCLKMTYKMLAVWLCVPTISSIYNKPSNAH